MKTDHDNIYHQIYSHPEILADLVRQFITEPWVEQLDFDRMQPVKTKYQIMQMPKRESDMVWKIPLRPGELIYLLLLLEFQSKVYRWMILRTTIYSCLLWLQLLQEKRISARKRLPPIFPVVLYNGDKPWLMPVRLHDLIGLPSQSPLWPFQPDGRFFLIDEGRYPQEELKQRDSLSALIFRIEQCTDPEEFSSLLTEVIAWFARYPDLTELKSAITALFHNALTTMAGETPVPVHASFANLLEEPTMLRTRIQ
ncbi:MAG: Rpn family recombination-promoting nuclease/putative transposase, partial [Magnetococcales bacterium]|nr:Rpn family recombination-promoting nuclease/putative transposase [Magnetococcales bacterium]